MLKYLNARNVPNLNVLNHLEVRNKIILNALIKIANKHYSFKDMCHFVIARAMRSFYLQC